MGSARVSAGARAQPPAEEFSTSSYWSEAPPASAEAPGSAPARAAAEPARSLRPDSPVDAPPAAVAVALGGRQPHRIGELVEVLGDDGEARVADRLDEGAAGRPEGALVLPGRPLQLGQRALVRAGVEIALDEPA